MLTYSFVAIFKRLLVVTNHWDEEPLIQTWAKFTVVDAPQAGPSREISRKLRVVSENLQINNEILGLARKKQKSLQICYTYSLYLWSN